MPRKLKAVVALQFIGAILNLVGGHWILAAIGALLGLLLLKGSNVVRLIILMFALVMLGWHVLQVGGVVLLLAASELGAHTDLDASRAITGVLSMFAEVFTLWALTRRDVKAFVHADADPA